MSSQTRRPVSAKDVEEGVITPPDPGAAVGGFHQGFELGSGQVGDLGVMATFRGHVGHHPAWSVTDVKRQVNGRAPSSGTVQATIVLCLHDELLVHAPTANGDTVAVLLADTLQEAARRFAPDNKVRFVADIAVIGRWSDAKPPAPPPERHPNI